jgi:hypothetical protein
MAWTPREKRSWRSCIEFLEEAHPGRGTLRVVRRQPPIPSHSALYTLGDDVTIFVTPSTPYQFAFDGLLHEWAHWLADDFRGTEHSAIHDHSDLWGIAYATLYRAMLRWNPKE